VRQSCERRTYRTDHPKELRLDWHTVKALGQQYMREQLRRVGPPGPRVIGICIYERTMRRTPRCMPWTARASVRPMPNGSNRSPKPIMSTPGQATTATSASKCGVRSSFTRTTMNFAAGPRGRLLQERLHRPSRLGLSGFPDRILQVERHGPGIAGQGLHEELGPRGGYEQLAAHEEIHGGRSGAEADRMRHAAVTPDAGVLETREDPFRNHLRMLEHILHRARRRTGDALAQQHFPFERGMRPEGRSNPVQEIAGVLRPLPPRANVGIARELGETGQLA
jgi:hypothetical protein